MPLASNTRFKMAAILIYAAIAILLWRGWAIRPIACNANDWTWSFCLGTLPQVATFLLFGLIPMGIVKFLFKEKLSDYGVGIGITKYTVRSFLLTAPVIVGIGLLAGHDPLFFDVYPLNEAIRPQQARIGIGIFFIHALLYLSYYWGWEFFFRGFLQHGLSEKTGLLLAVLLQTALSTALHVGHPVSEMIGAVVAGFYWGFLAVRTKSILSGFLQHALLGIVLDAVLVFGR